MAIRDKYQSPENWWRRSMGAVVAYPRSPAEQAPVQLPSLDEIVTLDDLRRRARPVAASAPPPAPEPMPAEVAQQQAAAAPDPNTSAMQRMIGQLSPDQRSRLMQSTLAGGASALLPLMGPQRNKVGIGQVLAAAGLGMTQGRMAGEEALARGAREERVAQAQDRTLDLQEQRLRVAQEAEQRELEEAQRRQAIIEQLPPEAQQLLAAFPQAQSAILERTMPKPPPEMTPYQSAMVDIARDRLSMQGRGEGAGDGTALMRNAKYLAQVKNISEGKAADFLLQSSAARSNPDKARDDIFKIMLKEHYGDVQEAFRSTDEAMRFLEGGAEALPEEPQEGPSKGVWAGIQEWWAGESEEAAPEQPAQAAPAQQQQPAAQPPTGQIEQWTLEQLSAVDPYSLSEEDRRRAADRWDVLHGG